MKCFLDIVYDSLKVSSNDYYKSIIISFDYNEYSIDLCIYNEDDDAIFIDDKIHILNKHTHSYEVHYENCDKILFKILDLKYTTIEELNDFVRNLFECSFG